MISHAVIWLLLQEHIVAQHPADVKKMAIQTEPTFALKP